MERDLDELEKEYKERGLEDNSEAMTASECCILFKQSEDEGICQALLKCWNAAFMAGMHYQKEQNAI